MARSKPNFGRETLDNFRNALTFDDNGVAIQFKGHEISEYGECPAHGKYPKKYRVYHGRGFPCSEYELPVQCLSCQEEALMAYLLGWAAIPKRYENKTFDSFVTETDEQKKAFKAVKKFADDIDAALKDGRCLILCGSTGTGKTHLACALVREALRSQKTAQFTTVSRLIRRVRASWGTKEEQETLNAFVNLDILILDEVGVQAGSDNEKNILFDVINSRYEEMKSTIIISNCDIEGIKEFLGERIIDRLRENGGRLIPFSGKSYRASKSNTA